MKKIEKPAILITSLGRTGTDFFAKFFSHLVPTATSLHEPDIFQRVGVDNSFGHFLTQVQRAGIWRMIVLKALGKWTLVKLSDTRFTGKLDAPTARRALSGQRATFIQRMPGSVYVEANIGYYGLLDVTPTLFKSHKAIYIVRDGRDWIRSHMNWGQFYGKKGLRKLIEHNWPTASETPNDSYAHTWPGLTRFERLCWAWTRLNEYALKTLEQNPDARVFQFEKIFSGAGRYQVLDELIAFTTLQPGIDSKDLRSPAGWLERKIHQSTEAFPGWAEWSPSQKEFFTTLCGDLMAKLGYSLDN